MLCRIPQWNYGRTDSVSRFNPVPNTERTQIMSTTPAAPVATPAVQSWLQKHERIVIVALVLAAGSWGLQHYLDNAAAKAETRATVAEQALVLQKAADTQLASTVAQVTQQYQAMVQALTAQNSSLAAAAASRQTAQTANQAKDATLPLIDLANRLQTLGKAPEGTVSASGNSVNLTQPGAVAVVQQLETIPELQGDLKDTQAALGASQGALTQAGTVITGQAKEITGLNLAATDQDKACKTQIAAVKADARKSKIKWFKIGFISGFVTGLWGGHAGL
jgi:hypothetical protein